MKHKFLVALMAIAAALCMTFALAGCGEEEKGGEGEQGSQQGEQGSQQGEQGGEQGEQGDDSEEGTEGLQYQKRKDEAGNEYAAVVGLGTALETDIVIPAVYRGLPVKEIADDAFRVTGNLSLNNTLTSVVIPDSVTVIGESAFYSCENLASVTIGNGVTVIGSSAFSSCKNLASVKIGSGVSVIGSSAFYGCGLTEISIPEGVTSIGEGAFSRCSGLTKITVAEHNQNYHVAENCLIETQSKTLIAGCNTSKIPDDGSVNVIGASAFEGCSGLTKITIPESVTSIGIAAFYDCINLVEVYFENPNGWVAHSGIPQYDRPDTESLSQLQNPSQAAYYLTDQYSIYEWKREG